MSRVTTFAALTALLWAGMAGASLAGACAGPGPAPLLAAGPAGLGVLAVAGVGYVAVRIVRKRRP